ncbi:MAG: ABC transporter substrate-binding protein [Phyllobacterium sp.]
MLALSMAALFQPNPASAGEQRVAIIDWAMLETSLAIGKVPVAATELMQFRLTAIEPDVPESVADLGLRGTPNFEMLRMAAPDLILSSNFYEHRRASFEKVAPVFSMPVYEPGMPPFGLAEKLTLALGERLDRRVQARNYVVETQAKIDDLRIRLQEQNHRPVFLISIGDARHFRAFGNDSMFGEVLRKMGFSNAWSGASSYSATAPVGLEALARVPEASIAIIGPIPPEARRALPASALWNALPAVRDGRAVTLDPINHFGALPAARRFARIFADSPLFAGSASDD